MFKAGEEQKVCSLCTEIRKKHMGYHAIIRVLP